MQIIRKFKVGRFWCELKVGGEPPLVRMAAEWDPDVPAKGSLTPKDLEDYRKERNAALRDYAEAAGLSGCILVLE